MGKPHHSMSHVSGSYTTGAVFSYYTNSLGIGDYNFTFYCNDGNGGSDSIVPNFGEFTIDSLLHDYSSSLVYIQGVACNYPYYYTCSENSDAYQKKWMSNNTLVWQRSSSSCVTKYSDFFYKDGYLYVADYTGYYPYVENVTESSGNCNSQLIGEPGLAQEYFTEGVCYHEWNGTGYWWLSSHWDEAQSPEYNATCFRQYDTDGNFVNHFHASNGSVPESGGASDRQSDHNGLECFEIDNITYFWATIHDDTNEDVGNGLQIYRFNGTALTLVQEELDWNWATQGIQANETDNIDEVWFAERHSGGSSDVRCYDFDKTPDVGIGPIVTYFEESEIPEQEIGFVSINNLGNNSVTQNVSRCFNWTRDENATVYSIRISNTSAMDDVFLQLDNITVSGGWCTNSFLNTSNSASPYSYNYWENITHCYFYLPYVYNISGYGYDYYQVRAYTTG